MKTFGWVFLLSVIMGITVSGLMAKESLEILIPANQTIYHEEYAGVTVKLNDRNITRIMVVTDRNVRYPIELTRECDDVCSKSIQLHPGQNTIRVWGYKGDKVVAEARSDIYHVSKVFKGFKDPPLKYKNSFFHTEENEKLCSDCHDMSVNEKKGVAFLDIKDSNCYMCHQNITTEKHAHAPSVNWLCTSCHNGKTGDKNNEWAGQSKYLTPEPVNETCYSCHTQNKEYWEPKAHKHFPVAAGFCTKCHNPHSSKNQYFLRETELTLCLECHGDKKMPQAMRGNSKCAGTQEGSCVKCHNPHVSDHKFFLDSPQTPKSDSNKPRLP